MCCLYFISDILTFQPFPVLFFSLILSHGANQIEQVGPRSYRTQVQQAERLASWRFSTSAKCVVEKRLFCLMLYVILIVIKFALSAFAQQHSSTHHLANSFKISNSKVTRKQTMLQKLF